MSRLQINPPFAIVYPNDRVTFTPQATAPPGMWVGVGNSGDIKSDFSLEVDSGQTSVSGFSGHKLASGIGFVEWTLDDSFRPVTPAGPGQWIFSGHCFNVTPNITYRVEVNPTSIVIKDEDLTTLATISYSTSSNDIYRLEMTSAGFRLYINGGVQHSRAVSGMLYPMEYSSILSEPVADGSLSRIPAPRLIGNWVLNPSITWTAPSHGQLSNLGPSGSTEFGVGTIPGLYTLTGQMEPSADATGVQKATATLEIPALLILSPSEIELQPSEAIRFKTNYDAAQSALVAWSVVSGGGSFTQSEYTATADPSLSVVRATASVNSQVADLEITVPPVITNSNGYTAAKPSEEIDFNTNILTSAIPILVDGGTLGVGTGDVSPGIPPNTKEFDIMLLFVETANEAVSAPAGWAAVTNSPQGLGTAGGADGARLSIFWKRAGFSETAPTIADPGDHVLSQIVSFRGCVTSGNPWDVTAGDTGSSSTSFTIPGATTTVINCLIVLAITNATDTSTPQTSGYTNADLANLTERNDQSTTQGNGGGFAIATGEKATAGAYGGTTGTLATASTQGRMSIALKPASIAWSASIGSINSSSGLWTAPSKSGQTARITVTNGAYTETILIDVLEAFPLDDPILPVAWDRNLNALVSMSEDRSKRITRDKAEPFDSYQVKFAARTLSESNAVDAFFDAHGFGTPFILDDTVRGIRKVGWFDSKIAHEAGDECDIALSFQFLEAVL